MQFSYEYVDLLKLSCYEESTASSIIYYISELYSSLQIISVTEK